MPRDDENMGVEIRVSFDQQVTTALDTLGLDGHGEPRHRLSGGHHRRCRAATLPPGDRASGPPDRRR
jgi:hypothetical protein